MEAKVGDSVLAQATAIGAILLCFAIVFDVASLMGTDDRQPNAPAAVYATASIDPPADPGPNGGSADAPPAIPQSVPSAPVVAAPDVSPIPVTDDPSVDVAAEEQALRTSASEPSVEDAGSAPALPPAIPVAAMPAVAVEAAEPDVAGLWAPDAAACSLRDFQQGLLPTIITTEGASAGETICVFKNQKRTGSGWRVTAHCVNGGEKWSTPVRLTLKQDRLVWESKRGRQVYTRCNADLRVAATR